MTVDPFIEAEKHAGHSVKRACELMKVSRSAYYQRRQNATGCDAPVWCQWVLAVTGCQPGVFVLVV